MSLSTYSAAVRGVVDVDVPAALSAASFFKPNERNTPAVGTPWVTYVMQTLDNLNITSGWRNNEGRVVFQCFVPLDVGVDDAEDLAEEVAGALRDKTFTGGHFADLRLVEVGRDDEGGWYQYNVVAEFFHHEAS